jgi:hypothetical protein
VAIWISSFEKGRNLFIYWFIDFGGFSFLRTLYILVISPLSNVQQQIYSPTLWVVFSV